MYEFESIELVKLEERDLASLHALKKESWRNTHRTSILNEQDQLRWYASYRDEDAHQPTRLVMVGVIAKTLWGHGQSAGSFSKGDRFGVFKLANIDWVNRSADVGWDVFDRYRRCGLGKLLVAAGSAFCFEVLNLNRLTCEILENNEPSHKCAAYAGFKLEGSKRKAVFKEGDYLDSDVLGLLGEEFKLWPTKQSNEAQ